MSKWESVRKSSPQADLSIRLRGGNGTWARSKGHWYLSRLKRGRYSYTAEQTNKGWDRELCLIHVGEWEESYLTRNWDVVNSRIWTQRNSLVTNYSIN